MQPKRLLQVASLLLLSAAVLGQVDTSAAMPEEIRVAMTFCDNGQVGTQCTWGARCTPVVPNCVVCQTGAIGATAGSTVCRYCAAGFFLQGGRCFRCPQGAFCGGASPNPALPVNVATGENINVLNFRCDWDNGAFTDNDGRWARQQCNTCIPGWGSFDQNVQQCTACPLGTAKNRIGTQQCSFCLDGFFANAQVGATDCINGAGLTLLQRNAACQAAPNPVLGVASPGGLGPGGVFLPLLNSCGCDRGFFLNQARVETIAATVAPAPPVCAQCDPGTFTAVAGALSCTRCPAGQVQPLAGQTACVACPAGQRPNPTATACIV